MGMCLGEGWMCGMCEMCVIEEESERGIFFRL